MPFKPTRLNIILFRTGRTAAVCQEIVYRGGDVPLRGQSAKSGSLRATSGGSALPHVGFEVIRGLVDDLGAVDGQVGTC